jgi:hypothetical protein
MAAWLASKLPATVSESTGEMRYDIWMLLDHEAGVTRTTYREQL